MRLDLKNKKILIIDDFPQFRSTIRRMLLACDAYDIDAAPDGDTAIGMIERKKYDIVMCDYNLGYGKKDGQQVLEEVKARGLLGYSSIYVMLTAESISEMVMSAVEYAPDDYLVKPLAQELVEKRLERLLEYKEDLKGIEEAVRKKEYRKAKELCEARIKAKSRHMLEIMKIKGDICMMAGDYDGAGKLFSTVLAMRNISWAKLGLGRLAFMEKEYERAKQIFGEIIGENKAYVAAYDWLARAEEELGDLDGAKQTLSDAVLISPKYISRQRHLGSISQKSGDYSSAEKLFKKAVELGANSYFKSPSDYTDLARALVSKGESPKALTVIESVRKEFKGSADAEMQASMVEGLAFREMGKNDEARISISRAAELLDKRQDSVPADIALDIARSCFEAGESERGKDLMRSIAGNNHDDSDILAQVREVFRESGLVDEGEDLLSSSIAEIKRINDKGIRLLEKGATEEAIEYFKDAASRLPGNKILSANVAHAAILYIKQNGRNKRMLGEAEKYLEITAGIDPAYARYHKLLQMYEALAAA